MIFHICRFANPLSSEEKGLLLPHFTPKRSKTHVIGPSFNQFCPAKATAFQ